MRILYTENLYQSLAVRQMTICPRTLDDLAQITIIYAVGEMFGGGLAAEDHCPGLRPAVRLRSDHNSGPESPQSSESS